MCDACSITDKKPAAAYIPSSVPGGKNVLVVHGFAFGESYPTYWRCSRRRDGCKAKARTNKKGELISYTTRHNHEKPKFYQKTVKKMVHLDLPY